VAEPVSVLVTSMGTSEISDEALTDAVMNTFDMRPFYIEQKLNLRRPIYKASSCYGHFGRERPEFTWEATDMAETLKANCKG